MDIARDLESSVDACDVEAFLDEVLDGPRCYRLLLARDERFDGRIFVGVKSTGIFCRPICPAPTPREQNCTFWRSAAAAQAAGFRPCLRCRPEAAPGTPAWRGTAASVSRALRLIESGALDDGGSVESLADRLGIGSRHLRRLFDQHLGTTPRAVAKMRRVLFAKQLLDETDLSMSDVATSAGFASQRRFNACMREVYGRPPSALRRKRKATAAGGAEADAQQITLTLPYRPPLAWAPLLAFLQLRAIPGVEVVEENCYARTLACGESRGVVRVHSDPDRPRLIVDAWLTSTQGLIDLTARLRRLFDLDADATAIDRVLLRAPSVARHVRTTPGVRVPGAVDGFETAVRAVLGQQISVKGATTLAGRIAARWGESLPDHLAADDRLVSLFPEPAGLESAPLEEVGLTGARAETIRGLARAVLDRPELLAPAGDLAASIEAWEQLRGIGPWTAHYVAMRVLREPDGLPESDLGLRKAITKKGEKPRPARDVEKTLEVCRPFRAYAAMRLWDQLG